MVCVDPLRPSLCYENRHKFFAFITALLRWRLIFMLGGAPKAHEVLPEISGSVAIRKNKAFNPYCPKVVCWTELPDDQALNSRCVIIPLQESERKDLLRVADPKIQAFADHIRQMLQQYRLEHFNRLSLARVPGDECLNSRSRDLYEALALPIDDANIREFLAVQFQQQQNFNREPLSPVQAAVLQTLDWYIHANGTDATCVNSDLTDAVNLQLKYDHELFHANPHQVGHVLTSFGLTGTQADQHWVGSSA